LTTPDRQQNPFGKELTMKYSTDAVTDPFRVEITTQECDIPTDERDRLQTFLAPLREAVQEFSSAELSITVLHHPRSDYHLEFKLKLPGETLFTSEADEFLDSAFEHGLGKLLHQVEAYQEHPNQRANKAAKQRLTFERELIAPEDPEAGPLAESVRIGDYRAFRTALAGYEDWLRLRAGRWVQRYPEAETQVGDGLLLGDLVEEIYLNAFERFARRPTDVPLSQWLESLIDASLKELLRRPDQEKENASLVRTLCQAPLK
jgi:ribosome-associated translation inhibitor RaiA